MESGTRELKFTRLTQRQLPYSSRIVDVNLETMGRELLKQSQHSPLEARMKAFLDDHQAPDDLKETRNHVAAGTSVSDLVSEDRDERFKVRIAVLLFRYLCPCQLPTVEAMGLSEDSHSAGTGVLDATSVAFTVIPPDFRAY